MIGLALLLGACVERTPHLYPTNDAAAATGVLEGTFLGHGTLHGTADITMPDGEMLHGEYSIVGSGSVGYGTSSASVYGAGGPAFGTVSGSSFMFSEHGNGQASLAGNRGTSIQCEFNNDNMTGHGYGTCRSSRGGTYRLQY